MICKDLQIQYNKIYAFFRNTTEYFDYLDWNGENLYVWENNEIIEQYSFKDLKKVECI